MSTAAKVALDKQKHPERYCSAPGCLWKVMKLNPARINFPEPGYVTAENCIDGRCPRHARMMQAAKKAILEG